jgi:hypothetical protein
VTNRLPTAVLCHAHTALCIYFLRISVTVNVIDLRDGSANIRIKVTNRFIRYLFVEIKRIIVAH